MQHFNKSCVFVGEEWFPFHWKTGRTPYQNRSVLLRKFCLLIWLLDSCGSGIGVAMEHTGKGL